MATMHTSLQTLHAVIAEHHGAGNSYGPFSVLRVENENGDHCSLFIDRPNHAEIARAMADVWNTMTRADAEEVAK